VLYSHTSGLVGGGNKVMLSLQSSLDRARFQPFSIIPTAGPMKERLTGIHVPHSVINLMPNRPSLGTAASLARAAALAVAIRPGIVHANDPFTYRLLAQASRIVSARRVCHIHHPDITSETLTWALRLPPHAILTPSEHVRRIVSNAVGPILRDRIVNVSNPIDTGYFVPAPDVAADRTRHGLSPAHRHLVIAGAIARHKGHDCFLRMAARLRPLVPDCRFHIVGSALTGSEDFARELHVLAATLGLGDLVRFWGFVPDDTLRDLMQAADLFVLPSVEEGFGLVLAESQACAVPVIATDMPPLNEVVRHGETGYLVPARDVEEFSRRSRLLLKDEALRVRMGQAGVAWARSFSQAAFAARVQQIYDALLSRGTDPLREPARPAVKHDQSPPIMRRVEARSA
jgi:glycosyltransferase involved in cell wall biosynthesis